MGNVDADVGYRLCQNLAQEFLCKAETRRAESLFSVIVVKLSFSDLGFLSSDHIANIKNIFQNKK